MHAPSNLLLTIVVASSILACRPQNTKTELKGQLEGRLDSLVQTYLDSGMIAGASIAIARADSIIFSKTYGYANLEFDIRLQRNSSFKIASMSKQFTAVAIMQLVEQGKLDLEDDIRKYVNFNTGEKKIAIRQLLEHTSGIRDYSNFPSFETLSRVELKQDSILRLLEKEKYDFDPGVTCLYSNSGYHMLGRIIEKASGMAYEEYLRVNFFEKLGMKNSYVHDDQKIEKNPVHGYMYNGGLLHAPYLAYRWAYATGSICSSVDDLVLWNHALHNNGILSPKIYNVLTSPAVLRDGTRTRYAKGLNIWESNGHKIISHGGRINGFCSEGRYFPEEDMTFIVLINTTGPVTPEDINDLLTREYFSDRPITYPPFDGDMTQYCGVYEGAGKGSPTVVNVVERDSELTVQFGSGRIRKLVHQEDNVWINGRDRYSFVVKDGRVSGLRADRVYDYYILTKRLSR